MSSNTAELESLLVSPYLWPATKYCDFYHDVSNLVCKVNKLLKGPLNAESSLVFGTKTFVEMMGVEYWDILKFDTKGNERYKVDLLPPEKADKKMKSLVLLLKVIRDKYEHIEEYNNTIKEKLIALTINGRQFNFFYKDGNGKYHLNKHQFVAFWNSKFPKLGPYLWLALHKSKTELPKYYPDDKINVVHFQKTKLDLTGYVEGLRNALSCDMENGNILRRFKGQGECILEFRGFHKLEKIRDKNDFITVAVNPKPNVMLSISHSSTKKDSVTYIENAPETAKIILIFAANILDDEVWKNCKNVNRRVVIFSGPDILTTEKIEEAVAKFKTENSLSCELSDSPIKGCELPIDKQNWVFEQGRVLVQGREIRVKDIFSERYVASEILSGNLLNKLLRNEMPTLFGNYKYPKNKGVYVERNMFLSPNENETPQPIYVAVNYNVEHLSYNGVTQVFNNVNHLVNEIESVKSDCEFILLKEHKKISNEIIEKCDIAFCSRVVRFLDYEYYSIDPKQLRIASKIKRDKKARSCISETEFLKIILSKNIKTFFFQAESGMGKSKLLISLGKRLEASLVIFYSFRQFLDMLQKNVGTTKCTKTNVKCVILEILRCKDECERNVIDSWLDRECGSGTKVELQLDGLDEVPSKHLKLALKTLKIIENDFDSVRLWITSSRTLPSEMEEINFFEWNILPFTRDDKYDFFERSWTGKERKELNSETRVRSLEFVCKIIEFTPLMSRIKTQNELTDYPLFCSMIAELYKDDFADHSSLPASLNQLYLYESLTKKKFALMIKKKIGKELDNSDNDFKLLEDSYVRVHKYFALLRLFPQMSTQSTRPSAMKFLTEENICNMRIITSIQPPVFIHLSYAHFFVALFIVEGIITGELDNLCSKKTFDRILLSCMPIESNLYMITLLWKFVNGYLGKTKDWSSFKWSEIENKERHFKVEYSSTFLAYAIEYHLWDLARLVINMQKSKMDSVKCKKMLCWAISQEAPLKWVIEMCEQLSFDNQNDLLICSVQNGRYEIAKYLIDTWCGDKVFEEIAEMTEGAGGIFHCIADLMKNKEFIIDQKRFVDETKQFIIFVLEKNPEEIKRRDNRGQTLLLALPRLYTYRSPFQSQKILWLKKFLVEDLNVDINERSFDGESVLCIGQSYKTFASREISHVLYVYHETLAFVASKNFAHINLKSKISGLTPLQEAVHFFGPNLRKNILELFRDLGANFNERHENGNTILHYSVKNRYYIELTKLLVEHGCKIDAQNGEGLCALCFAEKQEKVELVTFFREKLKLRKDETCRLNCSINNINGK